MKILKSYLSVFFLVFSVTVFGQSNVEAKKLLDEVSSKLKSSKTIQMDFDYTLLNNRTDPPTKVENSGNVITQGENYKLKMMDTEILKNGSFVYMILVEEKEVIINQFDPKEDINPLSILDIYKKGHSLKLGGTEKIGTKTIQYVILEPNASEEIDKIMIGFDKLTKEPISIKQWGTNGTITTINLKNIKKDQELGADFFLFDKAKYEALDYIISEDY